MTCGKAVEIRGLSVGYDKRPIFHAADLSMGCGEFVGLVGPNGVGKTTLFKVILGLLRPWAGSVEVLGLPMKTRRDRSTKLAGKSDISHSKTKPENCR